MDSDQEEAIRRRAHELWVAHGKPEGRDQDFWLQAESEIKGKYADGATGVVTLPLAPD